MLSDPAPHPLGGTELVHFASAVTPANFADETLLMNREFIDTPRNCFNTPGRRKTDFMGQKGEFANFESVSPNGSRSPFAILDPVQNRLLNLIGPRSMRTEFFRGGCSR